MSDIVSVNGYKIKDEKAVRSYETVALMKADTKLKEGYHVKTKGYYEANDGGHGEYVIVDDDTLVDNGGSIHVLNNGLRATLINNDNVNLMQYGCYGDGIHDDTTAIQNAINYAVANEKTLTSSNDKIYLLSNNLIIGNINIKLSKCTFKTDNNLKITATNKILELPSITTITSFSNNVGVDLFQCYSNKIFVPFIENFNIGLQLSAETRGNANNNITIIEIKNCLNHLKLYAYNEGWVNENLFIGGRLWNTADFELEHGSDIIRIYLISTSNNRINNNHFLKQDVEGDEGTYNGLKLKLNKTQSNTFDDLRYEGDNAKVELTDSPYTLLNNGIFLRDVTFTNEKPNTNINGEHIGAVGGRTNETFIEFQPRSNNFAFSKVYNSTGDLVNKTDIEGFTTYISNNPTMQINPNGIKKYVNDTFNYMFRAYGKWSVMCGCDVTNGGLVISPGINTTNGCYLWIYNGHLYGKMGQPNSESDGTIIL